MATLTVNYAAKADIGTGNDTTGLGSNIADAEIWCSAAIDNGAANLYVDALVAGFIDTTGTAGSLDVYAFASADAGTTYSGNATGSEGETSTVELENMMLLGVVVVDAAGVYELGPFSVAEAFGGVMPDMWGVAVHNQSGAALDVVAGTDLHFMGIKYDSA